MADQDVVSGSPFPLRLAVPVPVQKSKADATGASAHSAMRWPRIFFASASVAFSFRRSLGRLSRVLEAAQSWSRAPDFLCCGGFLKPRPTYAARPRARGVREDRVFEKVS